MSSIPSGKNFPCSGGCGKILVDNIGRDWYATGNCDKIVSGICPDCKQEKNKNSNYKENA